MYALGGLPRIGAMGVKLESEVSGAQACLRLRGQAEPHLPGSPGQASADLGHEP